jgi:diguanylate cyclase (GGDEF)-like protein/PAS domain S-box-containing protein
MAEPWTRERVLELVAGQEIYCCDHGAVAIEAPPWLLASGAFTTDVSTGQRIAITHPEDRQTLIDAWWEAVHHPGEIVEVEARAKVEGAWLLTHTRQVSLLDDPRFGFLVGAIDCGQPGSDDDFEEIVQSGEFEEARWLIHTLDETGVVTATEGMVEEITGRRPEEVIGQAVIEHLHPDGFEDAIISWLEVQNGPPGTIRTARTRVVRPDGSVIWVETTTIKRIGLDGRSVTTSIVQDLTDRRKQEAALKVSQQEFRLLADQVPAAVFRTDADQRITFRNQRWQDEIDRDDPVEFLVDIVHPEDRATHACQLDGLATGRSDAIAAYEVRGTDGERIFAISCRSVPDLVNESRSYVGSVTDITATVQLREQAGRDDLTGLANRRTIEERLGAALAADVEHTAVAFVDLDGFKAVNDTWGHDAGDHVLRAIAARLAGIMRPDDLIGRFGGDEFVLVLTSVAEGTEAGLTARIEGVLADPLLFPGGSWSPRASVGIARGRPGEDAAALVRRADHEMFADKRQHKATT